MCDCEIIFFQQYYAEAIAAIRPLLPKVRLWVCIDADLPDAPSLATWVKDQAKTDPCIKVDLDDVIWLGSTGGTTGKPKGVMNTHRSVQTAMAHMMICAPYAGDEKPVNLAAAPMTHTAGILSLPTSMRGGTVVVITRPDPQLLLAAIPGRKVTELFLPPTVIYRLLDIPELNKKVDCVAAFADFGPVSGSEVGARNGQARVECGRERPTLAVGEVRRRSQEPARARGIRRDQATKKPQPKTAGVSIGGGGDNHISL